MNNATLSHSVIHSMICIDSRLVETGSHFYAFAGKHPVNHYVEAAIEKGASVIVTSTELDSDTYERASYAGAKITVLSTPVAVHLALCADLQNTYSIDYDMISLYAITGTDGKTSTVHFARELSGALGIPSATIGTVGVYVSRDGLTTEFATTELTTPDIVTNHMLVYNLMISGIQRVFVEYSSIGIHQNRFASVAFSGGAWTTMALDHIDYHKSESAYREQKLRLFTEIIPEHKPKVMNFAVYEKIRDTYQPNDSVTIIHQPQMRYGQFGINFSYNSFVFETQLFASFLAENLLVAIILLQQIGDDMQTVSKHTKTISAPSGRFECITAVNKQLCIVDYAHTPDALEKLLAETRLLCNRLDRGDVWLVVGAGGERDTTKRAKFGFLGTTMAEFCVVTDDNPRNEDAGSIRRAILQGAAPEARQLNRIIEIPDRPGAIAYAIAHSKPDDIIICAGKGHEQYQIIGTEKIHYSDQEEIRKFIH